MQFLDAYPIWMVAVAFVVVTLGCYEVGFRIGRWWQDRMPGEQEGPTGVLVGAILGLMAFMLAVTMGMASDRFDARRGLVVQEANAIGRTYLEADYLPQPAADRIKELLREYLPLRIADTSDRAQVQADFLQSQDLHTEMWAITTEVAQSGYLPDLVSSFGDSLAEIRSIHETRTVARDYARVPETVLWLLLVGSALSLGMVGYSAGLTGRRSVLSAGAMVLVLGAVLVLVIDLDRPQEGFLHVSQQALLDVQQSIGEPAR